MEIQLEKLTSDVKVFSGSSKKVNPLVKVVPLNPLFNTNSKAELNKLERSDFKLGLWIVHGLTFVTWLILGTSTFSYVFADNKEVLESAYGVSCVLYGIGPLGIFLSSFSLLINSDFNKFISHLHPF